MRLFFTRIIVLLAIVFSPGLLSAQDQNRDYNINLHSGKFIPAENISTLSRSSEVFQQSFFENRYYLTLQFQAIPDQSVKNQLKSAGVELVDYIPNYAYTASIAGNLDPAIFRSFPLRSAFRFTATQKMAPALQHSDLPAHAIVQPGTIDLMVITYEKIEATRIAGILSVLGGTVLADRSQLFRDYRVRIPQAAITDLVNLPFVQWAEPIDPPNQEENQPGRTLHRANVLNDGFRNLKGDGINVGIWDGGAVNATHLDFLPTGRMTVIEAGALTDHGTHCSGTITSRGIVDPRAKGMAPNVNLFGWNFNGDIQTEMANGIPAQNLIVSSHSYGSTGTPNCLISSTLLAYSTTSRGTDVNLNNFPNHLHVHSSGNSAGACPNGYFTITGSGKSAKNNLVVANISSTEGWNTTSSSGPVTDGRIKPEISAMGTNVYSTWSPGNSAYATISGTSMATPGVAGTAALLYQRYKQLNGNTVPVSSLIKNIICNGAADLGNPGPDYRFGFGRINALQAVKILEDGRYIVNTVSHGANVDQALNVPAGAVRLKVMLTWNDPAGAANANPALVNDLDLSVIEGANTTLPWILDRNNPGTNATRNIDNYSNIEQVTIDNPTAATYTLRVNGTNIPTGPTQQYALTWIVEMPFIEVTYPNGNETLSPGNTEVVTWDNAGVTGNQTVEYSLDGVTNWTSIGTVGAGTTRLNWTVPAANTSTAKVRVTSGALSDMSDNGFKILGTVNGFGTTTGGCSSGEVSFAWGAVTNATHYDIYRLDPATGDFVLQAGNLTGTSHTLTGLTPGASLWFTIRAKNNTTDAESERAVAINAIVSSGGGGLGVIGSVTGQNTICGTPTNGVAYSIPPVSGANGYTWTAPPGASIVNGQGTNSITIDYLPGSTSGNVAVSATNGTCNTPIVTLAVTVTGAVALPSSGGNQSQNVCPGDAVPTLTASATVPADHTLVWYNAASGGAVVASPTLSSIGTITYYAASRNNASGCESNTRTAVTLTLTQIAAASATAGSATTFCEGGSVVLTANAGTSYVWRRDGNPITGATSQSYTANTAGAYTVVVTTGACSSTSSAINVVVNALPAAVITAGGPTAFCEGSNVQLTASAGSSWSWSNGPTTQSITTGTTGNYTVIVTDANGCSATSAAISVAVTPRPNVSISASPYTRLFPGLVTSLTANVSPAATYNYSWTRNGTVIPGATTSSLPNLDLDDLGSYTVTATTTSGLACTNTSAALELADSATTKLFIYPNPNNGVFQVSYYSPGTNVSNTLSIFDSKGALVFSRTFNLSSAYQRMNVDLSGYGKGLFRVVLYNRDRKKIAAGAVVTQ